MSDHAANHRLSDLAADRIYLLASDGVICTPSEVVLLNALAWEIETPRHRMALARGTPVFVGAVALWPLTLAADAWWAECVALHRSDAAQMQTLAYAMAHSRRVEVLDAVPPKDSARVAGQWVKGLRCRAKELSLAIGQVLAQDEDLPRFCGPKDTPEKGLTGAQIVAILCATVGGPPSVWESEVAVGYIREQMRAVSAQQAAESGGSLKDSEMVAATRQLGLCVAEIRKRAAGEANGND